MVRKGLRASGWAPYKRANTVAYAVEAQDGDARRVAAPTDHVLIVTGTPPEDFETTARRALERPEVRRSLANETVALPDLARAALTPPGDLDRYQRPQLIRLPPRPRLRHASTTWRREHRPGTSPQVSSDDGGRRQLAS